MAKTLRTKQITKKEKGMKKMEKMERRKTRRRSRPRLLKKVLKSSE
jgi:hypothetical protein